MIDEQHSRDVAMAIVSTMQGENLAVEDLQWISESAWRLIRIGGVENTIGMRPGDRVIASEAVNPQYVRGAIGTVIEVVARSDKVKVRWDDRFHYRNPRKMRGLWTMPGWSLTRYLDEPAEVESV
jgi:hypothetical protein